MNYKVLLLIGSLLGIRSTQFSQLQAAQEETNTGESLVLGIENIAKLKELANVSDKPLKVGLITNQTGITQNGARTVDVLKNAGFDVVRLYAPEHGIDGKVLADHQPGDGVDSKTGIPVVTIYRIAGGMKNSTEKEFADIDAFFFDMQDSGMRHYTYLSTMVKAMEVASKYDKKIVVFDRPNPLGGLVEGPLVEPEYSSFISIIPVPIRHGMTLGELAEYTNRYILEKPAKLQVIKMLNYSRDMKNPPFLKFLSPNIASFESCKGYSFLGLLGDIEPFDVGVGTDKAFQVIMLPSNMPNVEKFFELLAPRLKKIGIISRSHKAIKTRAGNIPLQGLHIKIRDIVNTSGLQALLAIIDTAKEVGIAIKGRQMFSRACGTTALQDYIENKISREDLLTVCNGELENFLDRARQCYLYPGQLHKNILK